MVQTAAKLVGVSASSQLQHPGARAITMTAPEQNHETGFILLADCPEDGFSLLAFLVQTVEVFLH